MDRVFLGSPRNPCHETMHGAGIFARIGWFQDVSGVNVPGSSCLGVLAFDYPTLRKQVSIGHLLEVLGR